MTVRSVGAIVAHAAHTLRKETRMAHLYSVRAHLARTSRHVAHGDGDIENRYCADGKPVIDALILQDIASEHAPGATFPANFHGYLESLNL